MWWKCRRRVIRINCVPGYNHLARNYPSAFRYKLTASRLIHCVCNSALIYSFSSSISFLLSQQQQPEKLNQPERHKNIRSEYNCIHLTGLSLRWVCGGDLIYKVNPNYSTFRWPKMIYSSISLPPLPLSCVNNCSWLCSVSEIRLCALIRID